MDFSSPDHLPRRTARARTRSVGRSSYGTELEKSFRDLSTKSPRRKSRVRRISIKDKQNARRTDRWSLIPWKTLLSATLSLLLILCLAEPLLHHANLFVCKLAPGPKPAICEPLMALSNSNYDALLAQEVKFLDLQDQAAEGVDIPLVFIFGRSAFIAMARGVMEVDAKSRARLEPLMLAFDETVDIITDDTDENFFAMNSLIGMIVEANYNADLDIQRLPSPTFIRTLFGSRSSEKALARAFIRFCGDLEDRTIAAISQRHALVGRLQYMKDLMDNFVDGAVQEKTLTYWTWLLPDSQHAGLDKAWTWKERLRRYKFKIPDFDQRTRDCARFYNGVSTAIAIFEEIIKALHEIHAEIGHIRAAAPMTMPSAKQDVDLIRQVLETSSQHLQEASQLSQAKQRDDRKAFIPRPDEPLQIGA